MDVKAIKAAARMLELSRRSQDALQAMGHMVPGTFSDDEHDDVLRLRLARDAVRGSLDRLFALTGSRDVVCSVLACTNELLRAEIAHTAAVRKADEALEIARQGLSLAVVSTLDGEAKRIETTLTLGADAHKRQANRARLAEIRKALVELRETPR